MLLRLHHFAFRRFSTRAFASIRNAKVNQAFDMVVVGSGMVGLSLTALLANSNLLCNKRVLLLDSAPAKPYQMPNFYESRTVALNMASVKMLEDVGAWEFIHNKRLHPVKQMKVWESESDAFLTFERDPLAYILENSLVAESLKVATVKKSKNITMWYNCEATDIQLPSSTQSDHLVQLEVCDRDSNKPVHLETSLLVGADGVHSKVRKAAGIQSIGWDHGQCAVVATLCMAPGSEEFTAWQRFIPTGPIALLPLSAEHSCLIWSTTNAEADRLMAATDEDFVMQLNTALNQPSQATPVISDLLTGIGQTFAKFVDYASGQKDRPNLVKRPHPPRVSGLQPQAVRGRFPLAFQHANSYDAPRVAIVGDAAHRILPLAGQGVNLGFGDVMSLVRQLEGAVSIGADIGSPVHLENYTSDRQRVVVPVAAAMEALNLLYSNDALAAKIFDVPGLAGVAKESLLFDLATRFVAACRTVGVNSVQSSAFLKKYAMESAITGQPSAPFSLW